VTPFFDSLSIKTVDLNHRCLLFPLQEPYNVAVSAISHTYGSVLNLTVFAVVNTVGPSVSTLPPLFTDPEYRIQYKAFTWRTKIWRTDYPSLQWRSRRTFNINAKFEIFPDLFLNSSLSFALSVMFLGPQLNRKLSSQLHSEAFHVIKVIGRTVPRNNCSRCLFTLIFCRYMFRPSLAIFRRNTQFV
jgi:hypothetical protein